MPGLTPERRRSSPAGLELLTDNCREGPAMPPSVCAAKRGLGGGRITCRGKGGRSAAAEGGGREPGVVGDRGRRGTRLTFQGGSAMSI